MLEVKNLKKVYRSPGGVVVNALNDVSIVFPEKGMVFLLGKSGSGKSTLLNVVGGLDRPTSGEIIIKGKNSKDFSGADFDSYRNTFIGFIFQEYNILNEFTIEQNISLALQLQGKKNDKEAVEHILEEVDLKGYGPRKPQTLSGGQKQRIAIARALIKSPEIIMADEPTGALDSKTGKQVFDTLKKLSKDKLIIVVSHDRDFAEIYGDRIIELADGKIISDVTKHYVKAYQASDNVHLVNENTVSIKDASNLSKEDMDIIYKALKGKKGEVVISSGEKDVHIVKQAIHVNSDNTSEVFDKTKEVKVKEYNPAETKFIRSKLPFVRVLKMGASSLKTKPGKLIFTAFLTSISLIMFGVASTLLLFKENYSVAKALENSRLTAEILTKEIVATETNYEVKSKDEQKEIYSYQNNYRAHFSQEEIDGLNANKVGLNFSGIYTFDTNKPMRLQSINGVNFDYSYQSSYYQSLDVLGFIDKAEQTITSNGFTLLEGGSYPVNADEILITQYELETINAFANTSYNAESIVNTLLVADINGQGSQTLIIKGVVKIENMNQDYEPLKKEVKDSGLTNEEYDKLKSDFTRTLACSYHPLVFVSDEFYETYRGNFSPIDNVSHPYPHTLFTGLMILDRKPSQKEIDELEKEVDYGAHIFTSSEVSTQLDGFTFYGLDGKTEIEYVAPGENQVYLSTNHFDSKVSYRRYFEKASLLINDFIYDADLFNIIDGHYDEYSSTINRLENSLYSSYYEQGYSYEEDFAKISNLMKTYYNKVATRSYVVNYAQIFRNQVFEHDLYEEYPDFETFQNKLDTIFNGNIIDLDNYEYIKDYIGTDERHLIENYQLVSFTEYGIYTDLMGETEKAKVEQIRDKFISNQSISDEERSFLKEVIENYHAYEYIIPTTWGVDIPEYSGELVFSYPDVYYASYIKTSGKFEVIGYFVNRSDSSMGRVITADDFGYAKGYVSYPYTYSVSSSEYQAIGAPKYSKIITKATFSMDQVNFLRKNDMKGYVYNLNDHIYPQIVVYLLIIQILSKVFLWIGIVFGVFAALMLLNFISNSIMNKQREMGILRALGARGMDVFKIFFTESGIVSLICSVISIVVAAIVCWRINITMYEGVGIYLLNFGILNVLMIVGEAAVVALLGTLFPVIRAAKKPPVDSIRAL